MRPKEPYINLCNPDKYFPGLWDLRINKELSGWWKQVFLSNFEHMVHLIKTNRDKDAVNRAEKAQRVMSEFMDDLLKKNLLEQYSSVHKITIFREELLRRFDLDDPYREEKISSTRRAFSLYPRVIRKLEENPDQYSRIKECCLRIFAGNIFDLGSVDIANLHQMKTLKYGDIMKRVRKQKWYINHLDSWVESLKTKNNEGFKILFFVDNSGYDFVCGCIPLARTLAEMGHTVIIAVNESASLNDIFFEEALISFNRLQTIDPKLRLLKDQTRLRIITTGNETPGIDFREVGAFVNLDGEDAKQMILEGQGRAIETNWNARFGIDCIRISTVKEPKVAQAIGAKSFDLILKFDKWSSRTINR
ncbi:MAG: hypothetical protein A2161_18430 [Candidatus Schekmanbacteria bacterium RBG_13_48_7]|uniref:Damage-control phosphatase ARMT1-like metal-binding domain-containing protein n=1 Tax=Candidatus Schekmanbacteria bacterium RBG_13_48_7 TaxID=1817878 RepID=A0A1F7RQA5_9BACT|nr:MAG: hypothetical protein A2161_18430 [Candidatus Schekmanbacteria bacterium RBG_13_48_7]